MSVINYWPTGKAILKEDHTMTLIFYPYEDSLKKGVNVTTTEKIEILQEAAERYKAYVLDPANVNKMTHLSNPAALQVAYNWDGLAGVLREVREMPEGSTNDKHAKAELLLALAEVYEILRAAKMQKLEAVRLVLVNEANQLGGGTPVA